MNEIYTWMLEELRASYPVTVKVPSQQGGYIRVAVSTNPEWYRELCKRHQGPRTGRYSRPRTIIRRWLVLKTLNKLIAGDERGVYAKRIKAVA